MIYETHCRKRGFASTIYYTIVLQQQTWMNRSTGLGGSHTWELPLTEAQRKQHLSLLVLPFRGTFFFFFSFFFPEIRAAEEGTGKVDGVEFFTRVKLLFRLSVHAFLQFAALYQRHG